jgi:integrating conjugative element membrane protein (TIGR03747 family)
MDKSWNVGLRFWIKWSLIIMLVTLGADYVHVLWPFPNGAIGVDAFKLQIRDEWTRLLEHTDCRISPIANAIHDVLYLVLYKLPGIDYVITRASDPTPMDSGGEIMRRGVLGFRPYWETAQTGLQLFSMRLAALALSAPLIALVTLGAISDGLVGWYRRRTGGGRESGFVFHRAKWIAEHSVLILCFTYLALPVTFGPRIGIAIFTLVLFATIRTASANFKKYI